MLGLGMIDAARDAKTWKWLATLDRPPEAPFRNQLPDPAWRTAGDPAGTFVAVADSTQSSGSAFDGYGSEPVKRAWAKGWEHVYGRLTSDEKNLLVEMLNTRFDRPMPWEKTEEEEELVAKIETLWSEYQSAATASLSNVPDDEKSRWQSVIKESNGVFEWEALQGLRIISGDGSLPQSGDVDISRVTRTVVALARAEIRDDTPVFRPVEQPIWFHEWARVRDLGATAGGATPVVYLQLHKQPEEYRGKLVTVKGTVRSAYRTAAPKNYLGIDQYIVYGIQPEGGPNSPILVYALQAPPGFPAVPERGAAGRAGPLREDVEVSGVFFKRAAYAAEGGLFTAPLLIADVPQWKPQPVVDLTRAPITPRQLAAMAVAALLVAICLTVVMWKRTGRREAAALPERGGFVDLGALDVGPSAAERLRELEREARGGQA
jgi:hypothetical protein